MNLKILPLLLLVGIIFVTGCEDVEIKKAYEKEVQRAELQLQDLNASGAKVLATDEYESALNAYNRARKRAKQKRYLDAKTDILIFYELSDFAILKSAKEKEKFKLMASELGSDSVTPTPELKETTAPVQKSKQTAQEPTHYTVKKGEWLYDIARKTYGQSEDWKTIYELNKEQIKDPNQLYPGQEIRLREEVQD